MEEDPQSLRMWFDSVDTDQSNSINVEELQVGKFLGLSILSKANGGVDYSSFCFSCGGRNFLLCCPQLPPGGQILMLIARAGRSNPCPPLPEVVIERAC